MTEEAKEATVEETHAAEGSKPEVPAVEQPKPEVAEETKAEEPEAKEEGQQEEAREQPSKRRRESPCKLGYCIFNSVEELVHYYKNLLVEAPRNADMNEVKAASGLGWAATAAARNS